MGRVVVINAITLDGVMQAPGREDEDTRDGFAHGGWAVPYSDEVMVAKMGERMGTEHAFLFGRRTYEDLLSVWNDRGGPFRDALNETQKYVACGRDTTPLRWPHSSVLHGDVPAAVAELRESGSSNLVILGSGVLISALMAAGLIDEYVLTITPLVLGSGRRLFGPGVQASLRFVESTPTTTGAVVTVYASDRDQRR